MIMYVECSSVSGNKPKWLPYDIELPKTRRRPVAGRPRASSQERIRATPESTRESRDGPPRDTRSEGVRRREGRGGGHSGGRESSERTGGTARRNRREVGEKVAQSSDDREQPADGGKSSAVDTPQSDKGLEYH